MTFDQESIDRGRLLDGLVPVAFAIAYRMLGSVSEAEDVVQEALLRVHKTLDGGERRAYPRGWQSTAGLGRGPGGSNAWAMACPSRSSPTGTMILPGTRRWPTRCRSR